MARITWNDAGDRFFEAGVDRVVLYPKFIVAGVAWNGVIGIDETPSGGEVEPYYFDGVKYIDFVAAEDFSATIDAFSAPAEFSSCDGTKQLSPGLYVTQQPRQSFGLSYRTLIGNDLEGTEHGYKINLVYNATAAPAGRSHKTLTNVVDPATRQWSISTVPPKATTYKPTAHLIIDTRELTPTVLQNLEDELYGSATKTPNLPEPSEILQILTA